MDVIAIKISSKMLKESIIKIIKILKIIKKPFGY